MPGLPVTEEERIALYLDAMRRLAARGRQLREKQAAEAREAAEKEKSEEAAAEKQQSEDKS